MQFKECFFQRYPLQNLLVKSDKATVTKAQTVFTEEEFRDSNGDLVAEICHIDDLPILKIYTSNPILKAQAQAKLTAKYMIELYEAFIQFLPLAVGFKTGEFKDDPIKFIGEEIRRRGLNFEYVDIELHYMLIEFNAYLVGLNKQSYTGLRFTPFTMDDLKAFLALCDVYKGIGCSTALRKNELGEFEFIRNLDWAPFNTLGNHTLGLMTTTGHEDVTKPQHVLSIGFTPGILGLSVVNDKGLIIALNEATKMQTKRENANVGAIPQFILVRQLIENCTTLDEVEEYIKTNQPATSHILSVMDAKGQFGVFEMLPNRGPYANELYHLRKPKSNMVHVSNHFLDDEDRYINGTEGFDCSLSRFLQMDIALAYNKSALDIARSTSVHDSIQTLIFSKKAQELLLTLNWANGFSATAVDPMTHELHYTTIDINQTFALYAEQIVKQHVVPPTSSNMHLELIQLMKISHEIGKKHPQLGYDLHSYYSELVTLFVSQEFTESEIDKIAHEMLRLIHSIQIQNVLSKPEVPQMDYTKGVITGLVLMTPLLGVQLSLALYVCTLVYRNRETLTNTIQGKSKERDLKEKIMNEVQRLINELESPSTNLTI